MQVIAESKASDTISIAVVIVFVECRRFHIIRKMRVKVYSKIETVFILCGLYSSFLFIRVRFGKARSLRLRCTLFFRFCGATVSVFTSSSGFSENPSPDGSGILLSRRAKDRADSRKMLLIIALRPRSRVTIKKATLSNGSF
jgi:hypothetical protein